MDSASCAKKIDSAARRVEGVKDVSVSVTAGTMTVTHRLCCRFGKLVGTHRKHRLQGSSCHRKVLDGRVDRTEVMAVLRTIPLTIIPNRITRDTTTPIMAPPHSFCKADIASKAWIARVARRRLTQR